jgi:glycosyltransferase involved in cell wall biosynthesis
MFTDVCLHLLADNATSLNRVRKEANSFLRAGLAKEVVLVAKWDPGLAERQDLAPGISVRRIRLATRLLPRKLPWQIFKELEWRRRAVQCARELRPQTIFCHSVLPLRAAVAAKRATGAPLIYDAHELESERIDLNGIQKRVFSYLERKLIRECDAVICVSDSIAEFYEQLYGIPRPAVVRNVPEVRVQMDFGSSDVLRERFGLKRSDMVFVYSGALTLGRRIEPLVQVFRQLSPHRHLVFMGFGPLEDLVKKAAAAQSNIHFLPQVPTDQVLKHTGSADVGIVGVENRCLSYYYSLPNKMFEYLLAGTPALVPDYPEMRRIVESHACGWSVPEGDDNWRKAIESLDPNDVAAAKLRTRTASGRFAWKNEEPALFSAYKTALRTAPGRALLA